MAALGALRPTGNWLAATSLGITAFGHGFLELSWASDPKLEPFELADPFFLNPPSTLTDVPFVGLPGAFVKAPAFPDTV